MQSFCISLYLYIMKAILQLLLLAILAGSTGSSPATDAGEDIYAPQGETYAVIISGGRNKMYNHERYWNDCAFLYRTLRQECNIPKDHVTLLMADGDNPATDMLLDGATGLASSPTDLDGDGQPDLTLAATRQNLEDTFRRLSMTLTASDHLFLFITDHGERDPNPDPLGAVHLWLWGNEQLTPDELAAIVGQCHPATMNILLGQCYAGAFVAPLQGEGRIITAACAADQMSWKCKDRPYDEFVYHWTCAIARHDEQGHPVNADQNGDGCISMQEAFDYARQYDHRPETPSITTVPVGFADGWSFSGIGIDSGIRQIPNNYPHSPTIYDLHGRIYNP